MKRVFALLLSICLLALCGAAYATQTTDYPAIIAEKDKQIKELEERVAELEAIVAELMPDAETYKTLQVGSKGEDVKNLQSRLKELAYLSGNVDGAYGNGTASAVKAFQTAVGLPATGTADAATQEALFAADAPKSKSYVALDYKQNARDPDAYTGTYIKFSGEIIQVMEDDSFAVFRIATKGSYDNVIYCLYVKPENYKRFLEDDKVDVWAVSTGIYTYTTVMGNEMTIPSCLIERIELK